MLQVLETDKAPPGQVRQRLPSAPPEESPARPKRIRKHPAPASPVVSEEEPDPVSDKDEQDDSRRPQTEKPPSNRRTRTCTTTPYFIELKQVQNRTLQTIQPFSGPHLPPFPILFSTKRSNRTPPPNPVHPEAPPLPARPWAVSFFVVNPPYLLQDQTCPTCTTTSSLTEATSTHV